MKIYILQHSRYLSESENDEVKFIGVYSTFALAEAAMMQLRHQTGFKEFPEFIDPLEKEGSKWSGFCISETETGREGWTEGFVTV
jgi:hypothetical protein